MFKNEISTKSVSSIFSGFMQVFIPVSDAVKRRGGGGVGGGGSDAKIWRQTHQLYIPPPSSLITEIFPHPSPQLFTFCLLLFFLCFRISFLLILMYFRRSFFGYYNYNFHFFPIPQIHFFQYKFYKRLRICLEVLIFRGKNYN